MKGFPFRGPELLSLFITFSLLTKADCEPHVNDADHYLVEAFRSHQYYNRTLTLLKVHADQVYVAGNNALFYLSEDLQLDQSQLSYEGENIYKILETSASQEKIFTCGSAGDGGCDYRPLDDIDWVSSVGDVEAVVSPYTTVGVIAPGRESESESLYIARGVKKSPSKALIIEIELQTLQRDRATSIISSSAKDSFLIHYSGTFFYNGFVYFLSSQRKNANEEESRIIPKLTRLCVKDQTDTLDAFTEVELACEGKDSKVYSIAQASYLLGDKLFIVFTENIDPKYELNPGTQSALCVYDVGRLEETFLAAVKACACGYKNASHSNSLQFSNCFTGRADICQNQEVVDRLTCGITGSTFKYPDQHKDDKVIEYAILEQGNATFSSVVVAQLPSDRNHTIAFIGTDQGTLLKANLNGADGIVYEVVDVSTPVLADTTLVDGNENLLVLTNETVLKMSVIDCSQFSTCEECIRPDTLFGDPGCGWCTLKKSCTRYLDCARNEETARWLPYDEETCVAITSVTPPSLAIEEDGQFIHLTVAHLPALAEGQSYECRFNENRIPATVNERTLECKSPTRDQLLEVVAVDSKVTVKLHIYSSETDMNFLTTDYRFYSCGAIKSCVDCSTKWDCNWCVDDFTCSFKRDALCGDVIIESEDCPMLKTGDTFIPNGLNREIIFTVQTPTASTNISNKEYECVVGYEGRETSSKATVSNMNEDNLTVTCEETQYTYTAEEQTVNASLNLRWKEREVYIDGTNNVILYKCSVDRPDCSRCLFNRTTPPVLMCIWCSSQSLCAVSENCNQGIQKVCTARPQITLTVPTSGPIEGGTVVQIIGSDLGQRFSDIGRVKLAEVLCDHGRYEDQYKVGESVTCMARSSVVKMGLVSVELTDGRISQGDVMFSYNDPKLTSFFPEIGPASGVSLITINGTDLDTGRDIEAFVGSEPCSITTIQQDNIECINVRSTVNTSHTLMLRFDNRSRTLDGTEFIYTLDPEVSDVDPKRSILSGGNTLTITGARLNIIMRPQIVFTVDNQESTEICEIIDAGKMLCPSPSLNFTQTRRKRADEAGGLVDVGFIMDGVTELLTWSIDNKETFQYVQDPEYDQFDGGVSKYNGNRYQFSLKGRNLDEGSQEIDVKVYIGTELCGNITLTPGSLVCTPPENSPPAGDINGERTERNLPFVIVQHANLNIGIGYLQYPGPSFDIMYVVIPLAVIIVIIACILFIFGCKQKLQKDRIVTQLEMQIAQIQNNYNDEMRTLFTNLKTSALGFEGTVASLPMMPICSPSKYIEVFIYDGLQTISGKMPSKTAMDDPSMSRAISTFSDHLKKKEYLEVLFHALDESKIEQTERANIVSHISLILILDGKYALLTQLLLTLIEKQIQGSKTDELNSPENIFRSGNTCLKPLLSIWITFSSYEYVNSVSKSLQQLYGAVKSTVELGPIDAVTGKSQFTINQQYLLDKQITFTELRLQVLFTDKEDELVELGFLSVDTITQAKSKIIDHFYREEPYSTWPVPEQFDLVLCPQKEGTRILRDDGFLRLQDGWRKLNVLSDYKVQTGNCVKLIKKQNIESRNLNSDPEDVTSESLENLQYTDGATNGCYTTTVSDSENDGYDSPDSSNNQKVQLGQTYSRTLLNDQTPLSVDDIGVDNDGYLHPDVQPDNIREKVSEDISVDKDGYLQPDIRTENPEKLQVTDGGTNGCYTTTVSDSENDGYESPNSSNHRKDSNIQPPSNVPTGADPEDIYDEPEAGFGLWIWHLMKEEGNEDAISDREEGAAAVLSYLPATRTALQKYVNNVFTAFMTAGYDTFSVNIKQIFDLFDQKAAELKNPNLAAGWKDDILPLGFWTDLLNRLHLIYDVKDCIYVQACLKIIIQTLTDVCKRGREVSNDHSSSNQLYKQLLPVYSTKLDHFYSDIRQMKKLNEENSRTSKVEEMFGDSFDITALLWQLYQMIHKHRDQICEVLHTYQTQSGQEKVKCIKTLLEAFENESFDHPTYIDIN